MKSSGTYIWLLHGATAGWLGKRVSDGEKNKNRLTVGGE